MDRKLNTDIQLYVTLFNRDVGNEFLFTEKVLLKINLM